MESDDEVDKMLENIRLHEGEKKQLDETRNLNEEEKLSWWVYFLAVIGLLLLLVILYFVFSTSTPTRPKMNTIDFFNDPAIRGPVLE